VFRRWTMNSWNTKMYSWTLLTRIFGMISYHDGKALAR
jgi:hypothetical protein